MDEVTPNNPAVYNYIYIVDTNIRNLDSKGFGTFGIYKSEIENVIMMEGSGIIENTTIGSSDEKVKTTLKLINVSMMLIDVTVNGSAKVETFEDSKVMFDECTLGSLNIENNCRRMPHGEFYLLKPRNIVVLKGCRVENIKKGKNSLLYNCRSEVKYGDQGKPISITDSKLRRNYYRSSWNDRASKR